MQLSTFGYVEPSSLIYQKRPNGYDRCADYLVNLPTLLGKVPNGNLNAPYNCYIPIFSINMQNTQFYIVAGHTFCLKMEDNHVLWKKASNYKPFHQTHTEGTTPIFQLTVNSDVPPLPEPTESIGTFDCDAAWLQLYTTADGGRQFKIAPNADNKQEAATLQTDPTFRIGHLWIPTNATPVQQHFFLNNATMMLFAFSTICHDTLLMHASVVCRKGFGYLFLGRSGTGKSTHSSLWLKYLDDCSLLNDDNPAIRILDGKAQVYGTPWSGKTPCYLNRQAPIGSIVQLEQAPVNRIERLNNLQAYAAVRPAASSMKWERAQADGLHHALQELLSCTPVFRLQCLPDEEAARLCCHTVTHRQKEDPQA